RSQNYAEVRPASVETGRWYDVRVSVRGDTIQCYLDGDLIHEVTHDLYQWGGVGLGSWATAAEYQNPKVTAPGGAELVGNGPVTDTRMTADLYRKHATWPETMVALRDAMGKNRDSNHFPDVGNMVAVPDFSWHHLHRDFPIETEQFRLALPDADAWFAERDSTDVERRLIESAKNGDRNHVSDVGKVVPVPDFSNAPPGDIRWLTLFANITRQNREALIADCPPVAFIKREAHARKGTNGTMLGQLDLGRRMGSSICIYDPAHPERRAREVFHSETGFIFDMSASFDGAKLVFSYHDDPRAGSDSFHIWEINADGTGLRQLTTGPYHDGSPSYLPDGRVVFTSTRVESFSLCQDFLAAAIFAVDPANGVIERLEHTTLCDTTPFVMDDGSIVFTRWEYQDKNIFCTQGLWSINPDGRHLQLFYGNTLTVPNAIYGAKQIPGTRKVICTMAAHHHRPIGAIGIIDRSLGLEAAAALINITPEVPYTPTKAAVWNPAQPNPTWGAGDIFYPWAYGDPYPIRDGLYLVTYGGPEEGGPGRFRLFLLRGDGSKVPLYGDPSTSCFNPVPLGNRPLPHRFARSVPRAGGSPDPPDSSSPTSGESGDSLARAATGTFFVTDIYDGLSESGVERGQVKALRVMSQLPKRWNTEGPRYRDHYPLIGQGTYYVKVNYGTVPVYEDGTAYFEAPAGVELYFIALDEHGKEIRRMGSTTQLMPGESQGCVGCHPTQPQAPPAVDAITDRLAREPDRITPEPWDVAPSRGAGIPARGRVPSSDEHPRAGMPAPRDGFTVSYVDQVQPVLDRYCISCHSGRNPAKRIDLTGDKSRFYNMSYR
ncbi:MAG TPA: hypothetical protein QGH10_02745, partial [Armatimonadota bacterium]|nr:hypothetical protein [Armatimonadota bacterium]